MSDRNRVRIFSGEDMTTGKQPHIKISGATIEAIGSSWMFPYPTIKEAMEDECGGKIRFAQSTRFKA